MMHDDHLLEDAFRELVDGLQEHKEKELYGAWRAGYDYLYVVMVGSIPERNSGLDKLKIKRAFIPSNNPHLRFSFLTTQRYDLRPSALSGLAPAEMLEAYEP